MTVRPLPPSQLHLIRPMRTRKIHPTRNSSRLSHTTRARLAAPQLNAARPLVSAWKQLTDGPNGSVPPLPAATAFRRCRAAAVVCASSSSSSSSSSAVSSAPKARFVARRSESTSVQQLARPLAEYMGLPASQYSVLDAERIERVDESTFRCHVYRFRFFALEVCPVLLVRVDEEPNSCCIRLLSCKLEGSPLVEAQNDKFSASMVNRVFCNNSSDDSTLQQLTSDATIEVAIDIPFPFQALPVEAIESSGRQVLEQLLRVMLPRFLKQLDKDYQAWASGDSSRKPLGTGEI